MRALLAVLLVAGLAGCNRAGLVVGSDRDAAVDTSVNVDASADVDAPVDVSPRAETVATDASGFIDGASDVLGATCAKAIIDKPSATPPGVWRAGVQTFDIKPGSAVKLCGDHSLPSDGGKVEGFKWTVQQEPEQSKLKLVPGQWAPCVQFTPQIIGLYRVCLNVFEGKDKPGCHTACVKLEVYPPPGIHVELSWQTTADSDPHDVGPGAGADLDLHFAHKLASGQGVQDQCKGAPYPWFDKQFDAFATQPPLKWGQAAPGVKDDPVLVDNTDGSAPETLDMLSPEGSKGAGNWYTVGVHYWDDHGFGVSTARVRVFIETFPVVDQEMKMAPADMWTVGRIFWPNNLSGGAGENWRSCFQQGGPCEAGGTAPWVAKPPAEPCVNHCFFPPGPGSGEPPAKGDCD